MEQGKLFQISESSYIAPREITPAREAYRSLLVIHVFGVCVGETNVAGDPLCHVLFVVQGSFRTR